MSTSSTTVPVTQAPRWFRWKLPNAIRPFLTSPFSTDPRLPNQTPEPGTITLYLPSRRPRKTTLPWEALATQN